MIRIGLAAATIAVFAVPDGAAAQDYLGSYLDSQQFDAQNQRLQDAERKTTSADRHAAMEAEKQRLIRQHAREIQPEYHRRLRRDGQARADAWLARVSKEYGRRDGEALRAKFGR
jgi:hypothetical protein